MPESQRGPETCDVISRKRYCYEASVNPKLGSTLARRLNQSCFPAVLESNRITIKFGTAEARRLNWAYVGIIISLRETAHLPLL